MITRKTFMTLTLAIAALGVAGSATVGWRLHAEKAAPLSLSHAAWKVKFEAPSDLPRGVDVVVLGTAVSARPGRIAFSENGEDSLPFEEVTFKVVRGMKGVKAGETVVVERAGGIDYEGHNVLLDADGGPFEIESTYLLFLKKQEQGPFYYQVNDQGRYKVEEGRLTAVNPDDPVAGFFHGKSFSEGIGWIDEHLGRPATPPGRQD